MRNLKWSFTPRSDLRPNRGGTRRVCGTLRHSQDSTSPSPASRMLLLTLLVWLVSLASGQSSSPPTPDEEIKFWNPYRTAYVDNEGKARLDEIALRMAHEPDVRVIIVGFALENERNSQHLSRLRAASVKTYLTGGEAKRLVDGSRIELRSGGIGGQRVDIYFVPPGVSEEGIPGVQFEEKSAWIDLSECGKQDPTVRDVTVEFEEGTSKFYSHNEVQQLNDVSKELREDKELVAVIVGFPDSFHPDLGAQRARTVERFLLSQGNVASTQLVTRVGSSGGVHAVRAVVTLIHRSFGEACIGQELDSASIDKPFIKPRPTGHSETAATGHREEQTCVLVGYLFPPQMLLRGWQPESGEITVVVGIPGDLRFEDVLHTHADLRQFMQVACKGDRPIGDRGARLGKLQSTPPSTLKPDLISDGFSLIAAPLGGYSTDVQTVTRTQYGLWRWTVTPTEQETKLTVRFSGGSVDQYILPIEVDPDWTWYLSRFWGWIAAVAGGITVLAKGKDLIDWLRPRTADHK
jgi:outer membrane protein OmpA-like peptidoglycan-associated protein